jgi:hypothetical protein
MDDFVNSFPETNLLLVVQLIINRGIQVHDLNSLAFSIQITYGMF